jgi:nitronate monooxygenase
VTHETASTLTASNLAASNLAAATLCELLGCAHPLVLAGMGGPARAELVTAVAAAGGFGFLGMVREEPALIAAEVSTLRRRGVERFGVNIIPAATEPGLLARQIDTIIDLAVPVVALFWDIDPELVARLRRAGILVVYQIGSAAEARQAERAGANIVIAQGSEAGGHVRGDTPLRVLLPEVVDAVSVPVLAAGGLARGADLLAARALGAEGIVLGTALLASTESFAHRYHKERLVSAMGRDTLLTRIFHINWPAGARVRVLSSSVTVGGRGPERDGAATIIGDEGGRPIYLFSTDSPLRTTRGDLESMALYAGTGVGDIEAIRPAGAILADIRAEAEAQVAKILSLSGHAPAEASSPACYAGEIGGCYMGELDAVEAASETRRLVGVLARRLVGSTGTASPARNAPPFDSRNLRWAPWLAALSTLTGAPSGRGPGGGRSTDLLDLPAQTGALASRLPEGRLRGLLHALRLALEEAGER